MSLATDVCTSPSSIIHEAIGVVMRENGCSARYAAGALSAAAQCQRLDVLDVARAVLTITSDARTQLEPAA